MTEQLQESRDAAQACPALGRVLREPDDLGPVSPVMGAVHHADEPEDAANAIRLSARVDEDLFDRGDAYAKSVQLLLSDALV